MPDDQLETARRLLERAGITPSEADLARVAMMMGPAYPRSPKASTEPQLTQQAGDWEERR